MVGDVDELASWRLELVIHSWVEGVGVAFGTGTEERRMNAHAWFAFAVGLLYGLVIGGVFTLWLLGW